ncbi:MAG: PAS domain S-box protein [Actinomycetota bacterium]
MVLEGVYNRSSAAEPAQTDVRSLEAVLAEGPLSVADTLVVAARVLGELAGVHGEGLLHGDVRPPNILVERESSVTGAVLGRLPVDGRLPSQSDEPASGDPRYLSPEQSGLVDAPVDGRSDIYSLGAVLHECLTCRPLFDGETVGDLLRQHLSLQIPGLRAAGPDVPRALDDLVARMLAKHPSQRYQLAQAVLCDIEAIAAGLSRGDCDPPVVVGMHDIRSVLAEPAFVGRRNELAALTGHLAQAAEGESCLLFLAAESGGGKTRLLEELSDQAASGGAWILRGQGVDKAAQRPYQLLEGVAGDLSAALRADAGLLERLRSHLGDKGPAVSVSLPELGGFFLDEDSEDLPEAYAEVRTLEALSVLLGSLGSAQRPAVVLLDDCQWTDELTAKLLERWLAGAGGGGYVLVVAAFRSEEVSDGHPLRRITPSAELGLRPFTAPEIQDMAQSMAGRLPQEALDTIVALSAGSPFMAAAVVMGMVECAAVVSSGEGWTVDPSALAEVQTSRQAAVFLVRRLKLLPEQTLRLLSTGAVLGKDFDLDFAVALAELTPAQAAAALLEAKARRTVWIDESSNRCHFMHDKIREALLADLSPARRSRLHRRAAEQIEAEDPARVFELAYHFDASGEAERALPYSLAAADLARRQSNLEIAESHYRMADRSAKHAGESVRGRVAEGLGDVLTLRGSYEEAALQFERCMAITRDPMRRAALQGKLGDVAFRRGDMSGARHALEQAVRRLGFRTPDSRPALALALLWEALVQVLHTALPKLLVGRRSPDGAGRELLAMRLYSRLAYVYWFHCGKLRCGWAHLKEMNLAERYPPTPELAQAYSEHAPVMTMIPWFGRGLEYARRSYAIRTQLGDVWGQGQSLNFEGVCLYAASRYGDAIDKFRQAKRILERTGDRWEVNTAGWHIAFAQYRLGRLDEAVQSAQDVYNEAVAIGDQTAAGVALSAWSKASQGRVPASVLQAEMRGNADDVMTTAEVHLAEALRLLASDDTGFAVLTLRAAQQLIRKAGLRQEYAASVAPWLCTALRTEMEELSVHVGIPRRVMRKNLAQARRTVRTSRSYRNNLPHALRELGLMSALNRRPRTAHRSLVESLRVAREQGAEFEEAQTLKAIARLGDRLGWPEAAASEAAAHALALKVEGVPGDRSDQETLSLTDRFSALMEAGRAIASATEADEVYRSVEEAARTLLRGDHCFVLDMHGRGEDEVRRTFGAQVEAGAGIVERALELGGPVVSNFTDDLDSTKGLVLSGVQSALCAPIVADEGSMALLFVTHGQVSGLFGELEVQLAAYITTLAEASLDHVAGSEARFRSLAQNSSDVITLIDADGFIVYQSSSVQPLFGFYPLDLIGSKLDRWVHPDDLREVAARIDRSGEPGPDDGFLECRLRTTDGSWRFTETAVSNLLDDPSVRAVVLNTRDITGRKRLEAQRKTDLETLTLSQRQMKEAQRLGHFGSFQWNVAEDDLHWSEELRRIFGVGDEEFSGSLEVFLQGLHPDDRDRVQETISAAVRAGGSFELEERIVRPDGEVRVLQSHGEVLSGAGGTPETVLGVCQDVTEQKEVEEALRASEDRARIALEQAVEASDQKSRFLANMSHEIRTPMNGVLGMATLLLETELDVGQRRYLMALQDSAQSLLEIINDILDFSKVEAGKIELESIPFDLHATVRAAAGLFGSPAQSKGLVLEVQVSPQVPRWVTGDPGRLRQILTNLLSNAVKFTDSGRIAFVVAVSSPGTVHFEVSDTGIGIDPAAQLGLLEPFAQADTSTTRRFGGTGLGLAISSQLVSLMGGSLEFESSPGVGSTFGFEVPLAPAEPSSGTAQLTAPKVQMLLHPGTGYSILLVEDSEVNRLVAAGMLEGLGFAVDSATDGAEALRMVQLKPYDAVLMDCLMPVMDGYQATQKIRRLGGPAARVPIIALTASAMASDRDRCLRAGMDYYLSKPMEKQELAETVIQAMQSGHNSVAGEQKAPAPAPSLQHDRARSYFDEAILAGLKKLDSAGDGTLLLRVIEAYLQDTPGRIHQIRTSLRSADRAELVQAANTLKGSSRNIGAKRLADLAEMLEQQARSKRLDLAQDTALVIEKEFDKVRTLLVEQIPAAS